MNDAERLLTLGAIRQVELQRLATWMLRDILQQLDDLSSKLGALVLNAGIGQEKRLSSQRRIERELFDEIEQLIEEVMQEIQRRMESDFTELLSITAEDERKNFLLIYGLSLAGSPPAIASELLVNGATFADQLQRAQDDLLFRIKATVRDSVAAGEAEEELYRRIKGGKTVEAPVGEMAQTNRRLETITRTAVNTVPTAVQLELKPRENVIAAHGWQHVSVLDGRTTQICRSRNGKRWDAQFNPIGHSMTFRPPPLFPPEHPCRSRIQLIFLDDPPAPEVSFKSWVNQLSPENQRTIFGAENFRRWQQGRMTDAELIRQQNRPLSIEELRKRTENKQGEFPYL